MIHFYFSLELTTGSNFVEGSEARAGIVKDTSSSLASTPAISHLERGGGADGTPGRSSIHRVTFNTRNEVASEDTDGSLLVTYCPLEQRIRRRREKSPVPPGREPMKVRITVRYV